MRVARLAVLLLGSASVLPGQISLLQIQVVEGEGIVHSPGGKEGRPLTVAVTDETGKPVTGAAVSFHVPEGGPGGAFANGLRTVVATTDSRGLASVRAFQANRVPGRFQVRIFASKEQARAGIVSFQYVGELSSAAPVSSKGASHGKWIAIGAAVAAGALSAAVASHGHPAPPAAPAPPATPPVAPVPPSIGAPSISIGKP